MAFGPWLAFVAAAAVLLAIPGPTILLVIGQALAAGSGSALPLAAGVAAGDLVAMSLSLAGLGALMAASATAFTVLKLLGAGYLLWLGVRLWRAPVEVLGTAAARPAAAAAREAFVVTALNPKSLAFFVAFVPQFIDPARDFTAQALVLVPTFVAMAAANAVVYALLAARLSGAVRRPGVRRWLNRAGAGMLVGAGLATAAMRRAGG